MKLKPYPEYKDSEIKWIGKIPEEWENFRLKYVVNEFIAGGTPSSDNEKFWAQTEDEGIPWVAIGDMTNEEIIKDTTKKITKEGLANKRLRILKKGTLIYSIFASLGKVSILGIDATTNQAILGLITNKKIDNNFLKYYLRSLEEPIIILSNANTQNNLNSTIVKNIEISIPENKQDQTTIANYLDKKTAKIDALIEKDKKLIELLKEKRTALINHAVTKGLDPNVKMKDSGIDWIGDIPEGWEVRKVSKSFDIIGSGTTPKSQEEIYYDKGDISWVITGDLNDGLLKETSKKITKEAIKDYSMLKMYPKNSLIIAMYGATIGKIALLNIEACTNQACCVLAKSKIFETKYVFYLFIANKNNIISYSYGGGQPNISQDVIKTLKIPIPPKSEQKAIVEHLDKATARIDKTIKLIQKKIELLEEYKKSLIHHTVTGKIDVRGLEY